MDGITILNTVEITETPLCIIITCAVSLLICVCSISLNSMSITDIGENISMVLAIISGVVFIISYVLLHYEQPTGKYEYEVIIDDTVSVADLHKHYEVIEQRGDIFVLRDKEEE